MNPLNRNVDTAGTTEPPSITKAREALKKAELGHHAGPAPETFAKSTTGTVSDALKARMAAEEGSEAGNPVEPELPPVMEAGGGGLTKGGDFMDWDRMMPGIKKADPSTWDPSTEMPEELKQALPMSPEGILAKLRENGELGGMFKSGPEVNQSRPASSGSAGLATGHPSAYKKRGQTMYPSRRPPAEGAPAGGKPLPSTAGIGQPGATGRNRGRVGASAHRSSAPRARAKGTGTTSHTDSAGNVTGSTRGGYDMRGRMSGEDDDGETRGQLIGKMTDAIDALTSFMTGKQGPLDNLRGPGDRPRTAVGDQLAGGGTRAARRGLPPQPGKKGVAARMSGKMKPGPNVRHQPWPRTGVGQQLEGGGTRQARRGMGAVPQAKRGVDAPKANMSGKMVPKGDTSTPSGGPVQQATSRFRTMARTDGQMRRHGNRDAAVRDKLRIPRGIGPGSEMSQRKHKSMDAIDAVGELAKGRGGGYSGKGKRSGSPGHYKYDYDKQTGQGSLFGGKPAERKRQGKGVTDARKQKTQREKYGTDGLTPQQLAENAKRTPAQEEHTRRANAAAGKKAMESTPWEKKQKAKPKGPSVSVSEYRDAVRRLEAQVGHHHASSGSKEVMRWAEQAKRVLSEVKGVRSSRAKPADLDRKTKAMSRVQALIDKVQADKGASADTYRASLQKQAQERQAKTGSAIPPVENIDGTTGEKTGESMFGNVVKFPGKPKSAGQAYTHAEQQVNRALRTAAKNIKEGKALSGGHAKISAAISDAKGALDSLAETGDTNHMQRLVTQLSSGYAAQGATGDVTVAMRRHAATKLREMKSKAHGKGLSSGRLGASDTVAEMTRSPYSAAKEMARHLADGGKVQGEKFETVRNELKDATETIKQAGSVEGAQEYARSMQRMARRMGMHLSDNNWAGASAPSDHAKEYTERLANLFQDAGKEVFAHFTKKKSFDAIDAIDALSKGKGHTPSAQDVRDFNVPNPRMMRTPVGGTLAGGDRRLSHRGTGTAPKKRGVAMTGKMGKKKAARAHVYDFLAKMHGEKTAPGSPPSAKMVGPSDAVPSQPIVGPSDAKMRRSLTVGEGDVIEGTVRRGHYQEQFDKAEGIQLAPRTRGDATGVIDDKVDPFMEAARSNSARLARMGNLSKGEFIANVSHDCPIHGFRDLTKMMNLANTRGHCVCS